MVLIEVSFDLILESREVHFVSPQHGAQACLEWLSEPTKPQRHLLYELETEESHSPYRQD